MCNCNGVWGGRFVWGRNLSLLALLENDMYGKIKLLTCYVFYFSVEKTLLHVNLCGTIKTQIIDCSLDLTMDLSCPITHKSLNC